MADPHGPLDGGGSILYSHLVPGLSARQTCRQTARETAPERQVGSQTNSDGKVYGRNRQPDRLNSDGKTYVRNAMT